MGSEDGCVACQYFLATMDHGGECRRHAPSPVPHALVALLLVTSNGEVETDGWTESNWPLVGEEDWCGEWSPKP